MSEITKRPMSKCEIRLLQGTPQSQWKHLNHTIPTTNLQAAKFGRRTVKVTVVFKSQTLKALNNTMVRQQESLKFNHACDLQLIFANKGKGTSRSFQQTFVGEDCVTSQKNVCVGGYEAMSNLSFQCPWKTHLLLFLGIGALFASFIDRFMSL